MNEHERGFLMFLAEPSRRRIETLLTLGSKRRGDVRALLDHGVALDDRVAEHLIGSDSLPAPVEARLQTLGAPPYSYVVASDPAIDGREMPLHGALSAIIGKGGAYVSCLPGKLAFFEFAEMKRAYVLVR